ncbi:MAG TPA: DUF2185 domain-containing protein [Sphingomicrobium sp.]|nr:DUF2185 domain-containing protein [Sphingomicrobium sp.]
MSYTLLHGPTLHAEAPYTFFLPHPWLVGAVRVGDLVKLGFEYDPPGEKYGGERMWVEVDRVEGDDYAGHIVNEPDEPILTFGEVVSFKRDNILDVLLVDAARLPEFHTDAGRVPQVQQSREYWERCFVDDCVLYDGVPVEYLYRETPEKLENDEYPDSGWRIRGRQGEATDDEMDAREVSFVALGAVLNKDDSWLHLIDAPIGSRFMRNFESGSYEMAD